MLDENNNFIYDNGRNNPDKKFGTPMVISIHMPIDKENEMKIISDEKDIMRVGAWTGTTENPRVDKNKVNLIP